MKANLFALFCITLFVLSVPQAFAEDTNSAATADQTVEQNPTEAPVTDDIEVVPALVEEQPKVEPTKPAPKTQEAAPVESNADEEETDEEPGAAADADAETTNTEGGAEKVQTVEPVNNGAESGPKTAPVETETAPEGEQDSTEQVVADKSDDEVIAQSGKENKTEDNVADTAAEPKKTTETNETDETVETIGTTETPESTETPETPVAAPTETPGSTNATNVEPSAPVSSPEDSQEAAPAAAEENQETAPVAESEEQLEKKDGLSLFGLISKVLIGLGILSVVILVGCVYHYRYQMQKYKIAPFTPPSFLPECLFPRNTESSGRLISGYTELQVGNYQSAPRFAEI